ncbi:MAG TPA: hypothetical protein VIJ78_05905 [Pseudolabrys sp.]
MLDMILISERRGKMSIPLREFPSIRPRLPSSPSLATPLLPIVPICPDRPAIFAQIPTRGRQKTLVNVTSTTIRENSRLGDPQWLKESWTKKLGIFKLLAGVLHPYPERIWWNDASC